MKSNVILSLVLGTAVSAAALWLAFRNVPLADLLLYLKTINYYWTLPAVLISLISFLLRTLRWQTILSSVKPIRFQSAFHPLMIGFMLNCILPGRVGEIARPVVLHQKDQVPFSTGFATVAIERVFDLMVMLMLFAVVLATVRIDPHIDMTFGSHHLNRHTLQRIGAGMITVGVALIAGILLFRIPKCRDVMKQFIFNIPSGFFLAGSAKKETIHQKLCIPMARMIDHLASGFSLMKYPKKMALCFGYSTAIWGLQAISYYVASLGCPGIEISLWQMTAVMVIICFFIALPSVPGFWGLWEAGGVFALALFGVSAKDAAGYTLTNHAVQVFPVIAAGLVSATITGINLRTISSEKAMNYGNT